MIADLTIPDFWLGVIAGIVATVALLGFVLATFGGAE